MKRQTKTTLGQLRYADRFTFLTGKNNWVFQVTSKVITKRGNVKFNKVKHGSNTKLAWWFSWWRKASTPVLFIRHTDLRPGDECFVFELNEGDVFTKPKSDKEIRRGPQRRDGQCWVRYVGATEWLHCQPLTTGIFVRRASLKTVPKNTEQKNVQ